MSQTEVQLIKNGAVVDADINGMSSSKLSGALPAISGASLTNLPTPVGKVRNLIINGAMQLAQRGTSSTDSGMKTVDRFQVLHNGTDEAPTQAHVDVASGTTPYTLGFRKALRVTNGNQTSGANAADDYIMLNTRIESQDIANSGWNYTSTSSFITLSFWVKSSVAQEFHGFLLSADGTRKLYSFSLGSLSADTWTKVTKTISGNSELQFDNNNEQGILLRVAMYRGTDGTGTITQNQWGTFNSNIRYPNYTSTWYTTNDATFEVTGFQLEVGSVATDFEHRSFAQELALCQRYYYVHASGYQKPIGVGVLYNSAQVYAFFNLPTEMRSTPTLEQVTGTDYFIAYNNGSSDAFDDFNTIWHASANMMTVVNFNDTSLTAGGAAMVETNNASAKLAFAAEL